jgi:hypothetical protein
MGGAGFRIDPDLLAAHARGVDALAERIRRSTAAARPLDLGAYGVLGQVFALAALGAADSGSVAVRQLAERTAGHAARLRASRESYLGQERQGSAGFGGPR